MKRWARGNDCGGEVVFDAYVTFDGELVSQFDDAICNGDCTIGEKGYGEYQIVPGSPEDEENEE